MVCKVSKFIWVTVTCQLWRHITPKLRHKSAILGFIIFQTLIREGIVSAKKIMSRAHALHTFFIWLAKWRPRHLVAFFIQVKKAETLQKGIWTWRMKYCKFYLQIWQVAKIAEEGIVDSSQRVSRQVSKGNINISRYN